MKPKGRGILALLGTADDEEEEPRKSGAPMGEEDEEDDDAEAEDAAQSLLDAIDAKDITGIVEAFTRLKECC